MREPESSEKDLRRFIRSRTPVLSSVILRDAVTYAADFYCSVRDYAVEDNGDGLVFYQDITSPGGRGTRLEIGSCRLFRIPHHETLFRRPAYRLRFSLYYKIDMDVVRSVLPEGVWSFHCWSCDQLGALIDSTKSTRAYKILEQRPASKVTIKLEQTTYSLSTLHPTPEVRQMWWGVWDVG